MQIIINSPDVDHSKDITPPEISPPSDLDILKQALIDNGTLQEADITAAKSSLMQKAGSLKA